MRFLASLSSYTLALCSAAGGLALDASKGLTGANHERAHAYATGAGVPVGVFDTVFFGIPTPHHLGDRLIAQYDFYNTAPSQSPDPLTSPNDDHERLVADIIASHDAVNTGVAPQALIVNAAINDLNLQSRRAASAWLNAHHDIAVFNLSAQFGANTNGTGMEALYWDWFVHDKDVVLVVAAANTGAQIGIPGDSFNGITVGAYDQATGARWSGSAYSLNGGAGGTEVRGKPDILAPGVWIGDGISFDGFSSLGTSFAAPHVAGAAALLKDYASDHFPEDSLNHRGIKALLLNSARKRHIAGPEVLSATSSDSAPNHAAFDKDYLDCTAGTCTFASAATAGLTSAWTPSEWTYNGTKFSTTKPLDDEQGVGYLDATRALINTAAGNHAPGLVPGIGWNQNTIPPPFQGGLPDYTTSPPSQGGAGGGSPDYTYSLNQTLAAGAFLTATLVWDRIALESDGDGIVDDDDTYTLGELANLDLRLLNATNQIIAESISTTDNVEHLHVPLPTNGRASDYKLQVIASGGGTLATDFALAWWTAPTQLVPGDYNLDGTVNAQDYEVWRANFGATTATSPLIHADGNHDGAVDAADYIVWRHHVGQSWSAGTSAAGINSVPECSTLLILLTATALIYAKSLAR